MLRRPDGTVFTTSSARYVDTPPEQQRRGDPKVYVQIAIGTPATTMLAMVDTGATWSVLDANVARRLHAFEDAFWVSADWQFGNVLGYLGLLDHIRLALDPEGSRLYFGPPGREFNPPRSVRRVRTLLTLEAAVREDDAGQTAAEGRPPACRPRSGRCEPHSRSPWP